jgi:hypothetical protein
MPIPDAAEPQRTDEGVLSWTKAVTQIRVGRHQCFFPLAVANRFRVLLAHPARFARTRSFRHARDAFASFCPLAEDLSPRPPVLVVPASFGDRGNAVVASRRLGQ